MSLIKERFGDIGMKYTLENVNGTRLVLTDIGASVVSLIYRGTDVVLGWDKPENYSRAVAAMGATVGRNCNRIAGAAFAIGGKTYQLAKNDGENNLHSGPDGYASRVWQTVETVPDAVTFFLDSPDGDQGFPGRLEICVTYRLTEDDRVEIDYRGHADADTVINLTNHTYFNLNGHDSGDIYGHELQLHSAFFAPGRDSLIPSGEIVPVAGTPFDFTTAHAIGRDISAEDPRLITAGGYDHCFLVDGEGLRPAAELTGDRTGITLTVSTDRPAVQLYTANFLGTDPGKGGAAYGPRTAVCLETQHVPNAVNERAFPSPVVKAGETYTARTVWQLAKT